MIKKEVQFETITPLFTGDVNQEMTEIKPAGIMGSLRFWFEVICHFSGFNEHFRDDNKKKRIENIQKIYTNILYSEVEQNKKMPKHEVCEKLGLYPTEYYFGATGWKSKIGIETIKQTKDSFFGNQLNLPFGIMYCDEKNNWIDLNQYDRHCKEKKCHCWFFQRPYFWGKFKIVFTTEIAEIAENILMPLLNFIQEYGFLGAKNNIGFGRVKIIVPNISSNLSFHIFHDEELWKNLIHRTDNEFDISNNNRINYFHLGDNLYDYIKNIEQLLIKKSQFRSGERLKPKRHYYFGSTAKDEYYTFKNGDKITVQGPNATKIIPSISEREIGFLGIPGIISMEEVAHE